MTRNTLLLRLATLGTLSVAILAACSDRPREITGPVAGPRKVVAPADTSTRLDPGDPTYSSGSTCDITIFAPYDARMTVSQTLQVNASTGYGCTISWSADPSDAVSLKPNAAGVEVYAKKAISFVRIKGTVGSTSKDFALQILPARIEVTPSTATILVNGTKQLTIRAYDHLGTPLYESYIDGRVWTITSSNSGVATINTTNGVVTGKSAGTAVISASMAGGTGTSTITVVTDPVASVTVSPSTVTVGAGQTTQLTATLKSSNGTVLTGRTVTWASSQTGVATVSSSGVVAGVAAGTATITATAEGKSGTATITVTQPASPPTSCVDCKTPWVPTGPGF